MIPIGVLIGVVIFCFGVLVGVWLESGNGDKP